MLFSGSPGNADPACPGSGPHSELLGYLVPVSHETYSQLKLHPHACFLASLRAHLKSHLPHHRAIQAALPCESPSPSLWPALKAVLIRKAQTAAFLWGDGGGVQRSAPKLSQVATRIQFLEVVGLSSPSLC